MRVKRLKMSRLNPLNWTKTMILAGLCLFYLVGGSCFVCGLSAFATSVGEKAGVLKIPAIKLSSVVTEALRENEELLTPERTAAVYEQNDKKFVYGHNTTIFQNLEELRLGDDITYRGEEGEDLHYKVAKIVQMKLEEVDMDALLANDGEGDLLLMTCAGEIEGGDYNERLIVFADLQT